MGLNIDLDRETGHNAGAEQDIPALREHVREIAAGKAFKGSDRCGKFLKYIVEQAIAGRSEGLKERVIGVEVFGRSPSYDTSEDAIVRVTATDVRKRLLRHYSGVGLSSRFRISLPVGSYVPEISCEGEDCARLYDTPSFRHLETGIPTHDQPERSPEPASSPNGRADALAANAPAPLRPIDRRWIVFALLILALNVLLWVIAWQRTSHSRAQASEMKVAPASTLPWSVFFAGNHATHLITSDGEIVKMQRFAGRRISVSDYANHKYIPDDNKLSPELTHTFLGMLHGDSTPLIDTQIAAKIAEVAAGSSREIDIRGARSLEFSDLRSDDNFIFMGSPYSDPWFYVFSDQLDFRILSHGDRDLGPEYISNAHPRPNEQAVYSPTARGGATGETYGVLALVGNPNQYGHVLLLAGISGEGTQAAGDLATDLRSLSAALRKCGIPPEGPATNFEMLLRVKIMAGYPSQYDVAACHILRPAK